MALRRWLPLFGADLMAALGLPDLWWCGLNLPRSELFGSGNGDVDVIAGPLEFSLSATEWDVRVRAEQQAWGHDSHPSWWRLGAAHRAAEQGLLRWPPCMDTVVGCEVKASWFSARTMGWKATHAREGRRTAGQLRLLLERGLNRVALLHLGVTEPYDHPSANPWMAAAILADHAMTSMPRLIDHADLPEAGDFKALIGAVGHKMESEAGAGGRLVVLQAAQVNHRLPLSWRNTLQAGLARCSAPRTFRTFVQTCCHCRGWFTSPSSLEPSCPSCLSKPEAVQG